ncbi:hypothetical protein [Methanosarcina sp. 2.H.A.1B.4]|uniref:hypothetical protein n=1 Tax=Methanosarcina sp. 2.H.A.1B.4 TaxID=1483600 RepID=UPI0006224AD0|nr:hypothetical protein [Methanosarcina sp. 2.H.A.1B.4]KKG11182.1 hypothetical protein EO92_17895 [Methanosarcina sp. 2.H.A.1B.4]
MDNDVEEMLTSLKKAIQEDRNNYDRVLNDPLFKNVKSHVLVLRDNILQETRLKTEKELSYLETSFKQYTNIPNTIKLPESIVEMIEKTKNDITEIKRKMKNNSYFDYLNSLDRITNLNITVLNIRGELIDFRGSSKNYLNSLETNLRNANLHIDETDKKLSTLTALYFGTIIIALISLFCFYKIIKMNSEPGGDLGIYEPYIIGALMGIGIVIGKFADVDKEFTILTSLFRGIVWGIYAGVAYFILTIGLIIIGFFSETLSDTIFEIILVVSAIFLFASIIPDKNISKEKTILNDEKRNINNIKSAISENKLIVSTLKSF